MTKSSSSHPLRVLEDDAGSLSPPSALSSASAPASSSSLSASGPAKTTVLLCNVGTPDAPTTTAVRRYLREFLSDPRVLDMNALGRFLLLHLVILPFRPAKSAAAYRTVWTAAGSPLLVHTQGLAAAVARALPDARVRVAMRYGNPSLRDAVDELGRDGTQRVVIVPLFPQYASATTGSALAEAFALLGRLPVVPSVSVVPPFFGDDGFLDVVADRVRAATAGFAFDHVLFSDHGLPVQQVQKTATGGHACGGDDDSGCCARLHAGNASCYRAQCLATTRGLVARLGLAPGGFSTSFQSRLGRARWLAPSTEDTIVALAKAGKKRLVVACPSFVADCLETLEEIAERGRELFVAHGGEDLKMVPCPNDDPRFADLIAGYVRATGALSASPASTASSWVSSPSSSLAAPEVERVGAA
ncbi:MAG: ferrochelatase [Deltaproteobacteria bacterium]|nr:ferrochelatase [Deltaproteobacteria bacterium]